jgi:hypothetical protein
VAALDVPELLRRIRGKIEAGEFRITQHAQQEMVEEDITLGEVIEAISTGTILEDYPQHRRGPCCLISGETGDQRQLHVVCTTDLPLVVVITTYEPKPPKWVTPSRRRET